MITIKEKVYKHNLNFFYSEEEMQNFADSKGCEITNLDGISPSCTYLRTTFEICIFMPKIKKSHLFYAELAHEIMHAVFRVMENVGVGYNKESEEAFTYLHTYYMYELLKKLKKNTC